MPLFWRLFLANGLALIAAFVVLVVAQPRLDNPTQVEFGALLIGLAILLLIHAAVLGQGLGELTLFADSLDSDGRAAAPPGASPELHQIARSYNSLLDSFDAELNATSRAALRAQEDERSRLARDLHDEVGQNLTFLLLRLKGVRKEAPPELADDLDAVAETARATLEEIRTLSRQLRPGVLEDLGLKPALASLLDDSRQLGLAAELDFSGTLTPDPERDIVVYRVVQEALTNIVKHAEAASVRVEVRREGERLMVTIADDGNGRTGTPGTGTASMSERARLVGGSFSRDASPGRGTLVTINLPFSVSVADQGPPTRPIPTISLFPPPTWGN